ncbi:MAG TPA: hypothetical protein VFE41_21620 [Acetobacteraceae bacterium]|jgi:DNA-binding NtrC family response regulator|nr:hypothetical protein [Acetobacteraceae bacterium]
MPARALIVLNQSDASIAVAIALKVAGYDTANLCDPMIALDVLETTRRVEVLIANVHFGQGKPNGVSLAHMAKAKQPGIKVVLTDEADFAAFVDGVGEFLPAPATLPEMVEAVQRLLPQ